MTGLDREQEIKQAIAEILHRVRIGEYRPGTPLPSDDELCESLSISASTAHEAVERLIRGGGLIIAERAGSPRTVVVRDPEETDILPLWPGDRAQHHDGTWVVKRFNGTVHKYSVDAIRAILSYPSDE